MSHLRHRYLEPVLGKALGLSPIVGVLGHRQVGKTTLLERIGKSYDTLDDVLSLQRAQSDPASYLEEMTAIPSALPLAIDECQLAPELFPALKERVRVRKKPGQFLLSGSVRFTSRKAIRESLTGRIVNFELFPLTVSELEGRPLSEVLHKALDRSAFDVDWAESLIHGRKPLPRSRLDQYLACGGLPGVCFIRERMFREKKIQEQLLTILDRDLRLIHPTTLTYRGILEFTRALAGAEGIPLRSEALKRKTGIFPPTQKKLIQALEATFVVRLLPVEGLAGKPHVVIFEDQAESLALSEGRLPMEIQWASLLYRNVRAQWGYRIGPEPRYFQYRTRGGGLVPLCIQSGSGILGLIPFFEDRPSKSALASASSFLRAYGSSKVILASVTGGASVEVKDGRTLVLPLSALV